MATRQKRVTRRTNPVDNSMSDDILPPTFVEKEAVIAIKPKKVIKKTGLVKAKKVEFLEAGSVQGALVDPRPRHKQELLEVIKKLDELKKEREKYGKNKVDRPFRQALTEQIAKVENEHRARVKKEEEAYLDSLDEEGKKIEQQAMYRAMNVKKQWYISRGKHQLGLKR